MIDEIKKIFVFVIRDFRILLSYKLAFFLQFINTIFNLFYLVLFGSMFANTSPSVLEPYNLTFIEYILIGSIGWGFLWSIMSSTSSSLSSEMMLGTLESILITRTKILTMMISYTIFGCIFGMISISILIAVGYFIFDVMVLGSATVYTLIIFILSAFMMMAFGLIFGGLTIWLKNIGQTIPLLQNIFMFFSAVYFPITVLPVFLRPVAKFIPFYYIIEGLRKSLDSSTPQSEIIYFILVITAITICLMVVGNYILKKCLIKAKKDGSLMFY